MYRELRKGREDAKEELGAADFYYGEMAMRRQAARGVERWLLTGYWAVSGYGLRASRAVAAFLIVVVVFAGLLYGWGFQSPSPSGSPASMCTVAPSRTPPLPHGRVSVRRWCIVRRVRPSSSEGPVPSS